MIHKLFNRILTHVYVGIIKSKNGFDALILRQVKITEAYKGKCGAIFKVNEDICDENGFLSNGFSTTLVDTITSAGLSTLTMNKFHVTVTLNMEHYKPANIGDDVIITTEVIKLGKTLAFMEAFLKNRNTGDLLVKGTHVKFILNKS